MDKQTAKSKLKELRDSLSQVLDGKDSDSSSEIREQSKEAIKQAKTASNTLKKSLVEKIKDLPIVQKVSELGTAGSVAVSTAAIAQTGVAIDQTEVFVASVANDVVEERFEVPSFIDTFVDFDSLNNWGQEVMIEKVEAAQEFVEKAESIASPSSSQSQTPSSEDSKSSSSPSSPSASSDKSSQPSNTEKSQESEQKQSETKEEKSSKSDSEKGKEDKQEQAQEQKTEDKQESQEESSSEPSTETKDVNNELPIIETPIDTNDQSIRQVSPTS
jgi:hypothetical protein